MLPTEVPPPIRFASPGQSPWVAFISFETAIEHLAATIVGPRERGHDVTGSGLANLRAQVRKRPLKGLLQPLAIEALEIGDEVDDDRIARRHSLDLELGFAARAVVLAKLH